MKNAINTKKTPKKPEKMGRIKRTSPPALATGLGFAQMIKQGLCIIDFCDALGDEHYCFQSVVLNKELAEKLSKYLSEFSNACSADTTNDLSDD